MRWKAYALATVLMGMFCIPFAPAQPLQEPAPTTPSTPPATLTPDQVRIRERMALVSLSTVLQAQRSYAAMNNKLFDSMACLMQPSACIPGLDDAAPVLDPGYKWTEPRLGYVLRFHPGPAATPQAIQGKASPTSLAAFAVTLTPEAFTATARAFCGDSAGRMCVGVGAPAPVKDGRCEPCKKLQ
jgi:hypothetical protein